MEDYAMNESGELSLHRGGIINVYEVIDEEWSRGELNGKVGKYPSKVRHSRMKIPFFFSNVLYSMLKILICLDVPILANNILSQVMYKKVKKRLHVSIDEIKEFFFILIFFYK
jgi:hypothetical protein